MSETAQSVEPVKTKSKGWLWLLFTGLTVIILGIIIGSQKAGSLCGSVLKPDNGAAELFDTLRGSPGGGAASCRASIAALSVPTWGLILVGVALILVAIIVRTIANNRPAAVTVTAPSFASQIEDLGRLREQGLINDEEFEAKRKDLLDRM